MKIMPVQQILFVLLAELQRYVWSFTTLAEAPIDPNLVRLVENG